MCSFQRITVSLVTYNSAEHLKECVQALLSQINVSLRIVIIDNGSTDKTRVIADSLRVSAEKKEVPFEFIESSDNSGYGGGHNSVIRRSVTPYVMLMNPDVTLQGNCCLVMLLEALENDPAASSVGPRLYLKERPDYLDSTGLLFSRDRRVVDRDKSEKDAGQHVDREIVFGVTGAAVLFRRSALEDVTELGRNGMAEYFDEDFFMYKEDVDLAWRLNNLGWRQWYIPESHVLHGRATQGRSEEEGLAIGRAFRKKIDPIMLRYAFCNHRLAMIKNERFLHVVRDLFWIAWRDLLFLGNIIVFERSTLLAYWDIVRLAPRAFRLRYRNARRWRAGWRTTAQFFVPSKLLFWR